MDKLELSRMYLDEHLTMEQIGKLVGLTRQGVQHWVKKHGIDASKAERFKVICDVCGKEFELTRKRFTKSIKHFCGMECYKTYLRNAEYRQNRTGQRIGRAVVEKGLQRKLRDGEVVHHIDGNDTNNDPSNLTVFASHSEHLAFHHQLRRERI
jgi:hypothetical protein